MSADQNVDFPLSDLLKDLRLLFGATETGEHFDAHRPVGEAVAEVVEMLLRQQGGRHQHRDLFVVFHRQERGAHRHFGFPEADVAAHQTIHCQRLAHVAQDGVNGLRLVWRGLEREAVAEQLILLAIVLKGETFFRRALGVNIQ